MKLRSRTRRELHEFHEEATRKKMEIPVTGDDSPFIVESSRVRHNVFNSGYPADLQVADGVAQCTWIQLTEIAQFVHDFCDMEMTQVDHIAKALWRWQQEKRNGNLEADVCDVPPNPTTESR